MRCPEVGTCGQNVVDNSDGPGQRSGQRLLDLVKGFDLFRLRAVLKTVGRFGAYFLDDQLPDVEWRLRPDGMQHPFKAVVVKRVILRF